MRESAKLVVVSGRVASSPHEVLEAATLELRPGGLARGCVGVLAHSHVFSYGRAGYIDAVLI